LARVDIPVVKGRSNYRAAICAACLTSYNGALFPLPFEGCRIKGGNEEEMELSQSYRVNTPDVVHETIDGEVVIVNLATGAYYSTSESGLDIWNGIDRGLSAEQLIEGLTSVYAGKSEDIRKGVEETIKRFSEEGLIVPLQGPMKGDTGGWLSVEARTQFRQPDIQKYTDMEDLLMLDPIHEVGNANWAQPRG
jgi:hypothetical protein